MDLFKSGNPTLTEKAFKNTLYIDQNNSMTVRGTLNKFGFMFLMLMGTAYYSWKEYAGGGDVQSLIWGGAIGGLVIALVIMFKKEWSPFLAPLYALLEGLFIGAISAYYNDAFAGKMPNIIMNAVGLTFGTAISMYLLYSFKIIQATEKFKAIVFTATAGIAVFYLIAMVVRMFGVDMAFLHEGSLMGIGFSLVVVAIAALMILAVKLEVVVVAVIHAIVAVILVTLLRHLMSVQARVCRLTASESNILLINLIAFPLLAPKFEAFDQLIIARLTFLMIEL